METKPIPNYPGYSVSRGMVSTASHCTSKRRAEDTWTTAGSSKRSSACFIKKSWSRWSDQGGELNMDWYPYGRFPGPGPEFTQMFTEVLLSTDNQAKLAGGILLKKGQGVVKKGTVIGKITAAWADQGKRVAVFDGKNVPNLKKLKRCYNQKKTKPL